MWLDSYNVLRGLHILAVIAWMAGLLYLPRLFVYHTRAIAGGELDLQLKEMEQKLARVIMTPSMIVALIFGLCLIGLDSQTRGPGFLLKPWMIVKIIGLLGLFAYHGVSIKGFEKICQRRQSLFRKILEIGQ